MPAKFQRRHYEAIAAVMRASVASQRTLFEISAIELLERFADTFAQDNPRFNRTRFLSACGIDEDKIKTL